MIPRAPGNAKGAAPAGGPPSEGGSSSSSFISDLRDTAVPVDVAPPSASSRVLKQYQMIILLALISGGVLYWMRYMGMKSGMRFEEVDVAYQPDENARRRAEEGRKIITSLASQETPFQFPTDRIQKDPFVLIGSQVDVQVTESDDGKTQQPRETDRQRKAKALLAKMRVTSVTTGARNVASIDSRPYVVGDVIEDLLTVKEISRQAVVLEVDGQAYTLLVDQEEASHPSRR